MSALRRAMPLAGRAPSPPGEGARAGPPAAGGTHVLGVALIHRGQWSPSGHFTSLGRPRRRRVQTYTGPQGRAARLLGDGGRREPP